MQRALVCLILLAFASVLGQAEQYWITYEGDDFPENQGWLRRFGNEDGAGEGGAERWIEDGVFVLDSLRHYAIYDYYEFARSIDPDPGEVFVAEWRVAVDESIPDYDATVFIARDDPPGFVLLMLGEDDVYAWTEGARIPLGSPGFHSYHLTSEDMESYQLFIDGTFAYEGMFDGQSFSTSLLIFGDGVQGARSLTRWDYMRFGVAAEPSAILLAGVGVLAGLRRGL